MPHTFHHSIRDNGVYAFVPATVLKVLGAYDMYSDDFGNTWASSSSANPRALNRATGYSHSAIVDARRFMVAHGMIASVTRATVKNLYGERNRKPPCNATVWHITCVITQCDNPMCTCHISIPDSETPLYYLPERNAEDDDVDNSNLSTSHTSMEKLQEVSNSKQITTKVGSRSDDAKPKASRPRNPYFDAIAEVCHLDPVTAASYIGKSAALIKSAGYTPENITRMGEIWYTRAYPGGLHDHKPPTPSTLAKYMHWVREQPTTSAGAPDRNGPPDESYLRKE
jgi:hypothetical protein